ncbi:hypothetical protein LSAT2_030568 [Lamellibrachia satsuma]|nr:hypothetical protein LSAT2_030568 [Lamellibrachia satsuma]
MSSLWSNNLASNGNDGDYDTIFHTAHNNGSPWWALDFGHEGQLVSWVRVTNRRSPRWANRLQSFTIELTDHDPRNGQGPPNLPFHECASHSGQMQSGETISVTCKDPMNTRGRYLFISAITIHSVFHLAEVEVFSGTLC